MRPRSIKLNLSGAIFIFMMAFSTQAEQYKTLGDWDVHYIVLNSTFLQPEIAKQYSIQRSKYNAFVNVSVLDKDNKKAQDVVVTGQAKNLLGTIKKLEFDQVQEQDSIYYLAQLPFRDRENYRFEITVRHGNQVEVLKFQQELVTD